MKLLKTKTYLVFVSSVIILISCKAEKSEVKKEIQAPQNIANIGCPDYLLKNKYNNLNISLLLDLSDRISDEKYSNQTMSYSDRDLGYIEVISKSFIQHIEKKRLVLMNDKIQLYFEPAPLDETINIKSKQLKKYFDRNLSKKVIEQMKVDYNVLPKEIYSLAQKDNKYVGSDIWRFFKDKVKRYCIEECNRNILIIITDGYMYHEETKLKEENLTSYITPSQLRKYGLNNSKWKEIIEEQKFGFIQATDGLNDLEVLVLGVENHDRKRNPYGKDIIEKYWKDWLGNMGVKKFKVYGAELPSNIESSIKEFILRN
jgi:hypothetical protein